MKIYRIHALVCSGAQCIAANGNGFEDALKDELKKHDLTEEVDIVELGKELVALNQQIKAAENEFLSMLDELAVTDETRDIIEATKAVFR